MFPRMLTLPVAALLIALPALPQEGAPAQPEEDRPAAVAEGEQEAAEEQEPPRPGSLQLVPGSIIEKKSTVIPDIEAHRVETITFVRRETDIPRLDLGSIDIDKDPVMTIGDRPVSRSEWRRRALMYTAANEVDRRIAIVFTQQEIRTLVAEGVDPASLRIGDDAVDAKLADMLEFRKMQARQSISAAMQGEGEPEEEALAEAESAAVDALIKSIETSIGMDGYRELLRTDAMFEHVFLPLPEEAVGGEPIDMSEVQPDNMERPSWLPSTTWDAMGVDDNGRQLRVFVVQAAIQGSPIPPMFAPHIVAKILDGLIVNKGLSFFFDVTSEKWEQELAALASLIEEGSDEERVVVWRDKLNSMGYDPSEIRPDDVFMQVGGEFVLVDELWYLVAGRLADTDINLINRELLVLEGMRRTLDAAGRWFDEEEAAEQFQQHEAVYVGTLFPLKSIILFRGYTSIHRYREHYRYRNAYNQWRGDTITDDELLDHYQQAGRLFFERGAVMGDLAYNSIADGPFNDAAFRAAADEMQQFLADHDGDWDQLVARFPPPPQPNSQRGGKFVELAMQRNVLRMWLNETELSIFLTGYSMGDDIFYRSVPGEIVGPWGQRCRRHARGAEFNAGSWMYRVEQFRRGNPLAPYERARDGTVKEDFLDLNYLYWAQESLAAVLPSVKLPD